VPVPRANHLIGRWRPRDQAAADAEVDEREGEREFTAYATS